MQGCVRENKSKKFKVRLKSMTVKNVKKDDSVRFVSKDESSVDDMLDDLDWPSLKERRLKSSLTFFYKIHSGTVYLDPD